MFEEADLRSKLGEIVHLFDNVKMLIIYCEEIAADFATYPQVLLELRNTLDHILRAISAELNPKPGYDSKYVLENLRKSYGHLFRAGYDALDWTGIELRDLIVEELEEFSSETILKVIPEYYQTMKPQILDFNRQIAEIRKRKDVANVDQNLEDFDKYLKIIKAIKEDYEKIVKVKPSLIEVEKASKKKNKRYWIGTIILAITGIVVTYFLTKYL